MTLLETRARPGRHRPGRRAPRLFDHFGVLIPLSLVVVGGPGFLQAPLNPFDGGLQLTLARFTTLSSLPYRDLWTLYGPGPPVLGSWVTSVFGRGVLPQRLSFLVLQAVLASGVYAVSRRFVPWWGAALLGMPVASFAYLPNHFHFATTVAFILWGLWFVLRAEDEPEMSVRRSALGAFLIGMSFMGRYEFAPLSAALVLGTWWYLRPRLGSVGGWVLVMGLAPPALFGLYLVTIVGWDRVYLNLIDYPLRLYPRAYCRGLPPIWGAAFSALIAPLRGRVWTAAELALAGGTFLPPVLAALTIWVGSRGWRDRSYRSAANFLIGATTLFVWLELRARAGGEPHPVWPLMMVSVALLASPLRRRSLATAAAVLAPVALIVVVTASASWLPARLQEWVGWPEYHPIYGFARLSVSEREAYQEVTATVHRYAATDEPIFVALHQNEGHFANVPLYYWLVDRPPGSRFIEFDPCLTDTNEIQLMIVSDLAEVNVVITTAYFAQGPPPLGPPPTALDDYLAAGFVRVLELDVTAEADIAVLVRRDRIARL